MQVFKNITGRLVYCILFCLVVSNHALAQANNKSDAEIVEILAGFRVIQMDDACGLFTPGDRKIHEFLVEMRIERASLTEEQETFVRNANIGPVDCNDEGTIAFARISQSNIDKIKKANGE